MKRIAELVGGIFVVALFLLYAGFGVGSSVPAPGYAHVYLDDAAQTYVALPCAAEWQARASDHATFARLSTIAEARKLNYKPDETCRDTGAFAPDGRSLSGSLLAKLGLLGPVKFWWDQPFKTEDGTVVQPKP